MVIKRGGITRFKLDLSHTDPHSNNKKCPNVPPEVKKEMRQLLVQRNKVKVKKATNIEEMRAELRGIMGGNDHKHLIDDEEEEEDDDVYMYLTNMNPDKHTDYRAVCLAFKVSE